jgi:hypothetical protein
MKPINVSKFARHLAAFTQCKEEYKQPHEDAIEEYLEFLPHGSGIDSGVVFVWKDSKPDKLVFTFGYHHMDENGGYDGWTHHELIITPDLQHGYKIKITGKDRNNTKEYLYELFSEVFSFDPSEPTFAPQQTTTQNH